MSTMTIPATLALISLSTARRLLDALEAGSVAVEPMRDGTHQTQIDATFDETEEWEDAAKRLIADVTAAVGNGPVCFYSLPLPRHVDGRRETVDQVSVRCLRAHNIMTDRHQYRLSVGLRF